MVLLMGLALLRPAAMLALVLCPATAARAGRSPGGPRAGRSIGMMPDTPLPQHQAGALRAVGESSAILLHPLPP